MKIRTILTLCIVVAVAASCNAATQTKVNTAAAEADRIVSTVCGTDAPIATCAGYVEDLINQLSVRRSMAIGRRLGGNDAGTP